MTSQRLSCASAAPAVATSAKGSWSRKRRSQRQRLNVSPTRAHEPAATRGSGRVGRTADGLALKHHALELAVIASIRHQDTPYDNLLMSGIDRGQAREFVRDTVTGVLEGWQTR